MTAQRWALVPANPALPVRVFDDEDRLDARHRASVQAVLAAGGRR